MGLRERKKARQRASILQAAVELSRERGFEAFRVRELIERLEISEATFFNYFSSKSALLEAWLEDELANAFADMASEARATRPALRKRVRALATASGAAEGLAAQAWRRARVQVAALAAASRSDLADALTASRDAGELRRDVPPRELAEQLVASVALALSAAQLAGDPAPEERAGRALDLVLDGARRRHERVRLSARTGKAQPAVPS